MKRVRGYLSEPRCIRVFKTEAEATHAQEVLDHAGFGSKITEDGFGTLKLKDLGMTPRFRLYVDRKDIEPISKFLAGKLKEKKIP